MKKIASRTLDVYLLVQYELFKSTHEVGQLQATAHSADEDNV